MFSLLSISGSGTYQKRAPSEGGGSCDIIEAMKSIRVWIGGRVQGVGYRAWATRVAGELGLRGWVRNRRDGSVEMLVTGSETAVAAMIEMARRGPPAARVGGVRIDDADDDGSPDFAPRATQ